MASDRSHIGDPVYDPNYGSGHIVNIESTGASVARLTVYFALVGAPVAMIMTNPELRKWIRDKVVSTTSRIIHNRGTAELLEEASQARVLLYDFDITNRNRSIAAMQAGLSRVDPLEIFESFGFIESLNYGTMGDPVKFNGLYTELQNVSNLSKTFNSLFGITGSLLHLDEARTQKNITELASSFSRSFGSEINFAKKLVERDMFGTLAVASSIAKDWNFFRSGEKNLLSGTFDPALVKLIQNAGTALGIATTETDITKDPNFNQLIRVLSDINIGALYDISSEIAHTQQSRSGNINGVIGHLFKNAIEGNVQEIKTLSNLQKSLAYIAGRESKTRSAAAGAAREQLVEQMARFIPLIRLYDELNMDYKKTGGPKRNIPSSMGDWLFEHAGITQYGFSETLRAGEELSQTGQYDISRARPAIEMLGEFGTFMGADNDLDYPTGHPKNPESFFSFMEGFDLGKPVTSKTLPLRLTNDAVSSQYSYPGLNPFLYRADRQAAEGPDEYIRNYFNKFEGEGAPGISEKIGIEHAERFKATRQIGELERIKELEIILNNIDPKTINSKQAEDILANYNLQFSAWSSSGRYIVSAPVRALRLSLEGIIEERLKPSFRRNALERIDTIKSYVTALKNNLSAELNILSKTKRTFAAVTNEFKDMVKPLNLAAARSSGRYIEQSRAAQLRAGGLSVVAPEAYSGLPSIYRNGAVTAIYNSANMGGHNIIFGFNPPGMAANAGSIQSKLHTIGTTTLGEILTEREGNRRVSTTFSNPQLYDLLSTHGLGNVAKEIQQVMSTISANPLQDHSINIKNYSALNARLDGVIRSMVRLSQGSHQSGTDDIRVTESIASTYIARAIQDVMASFYTVGQTSEINKDSLESFLFTSIQDASFSLFYRDIEKRKGTNIVPIVADILARSGGWIQAAYESNQLFPVISDKGLFTYNNNKIETHLFKDLTNKQKASVMRQAMLSAYEKRAAAELTSPYRISHYSSVSNVHNTEQYLRVLLQNEDMMDISIETWARILESKSAAAGTNMSEVLGAVNETLGTDENKMLLGYINDEVITSYNDTISKRKRPISQGGLGWTESPLVDRGQLYNLSMEEKNSPIAVTRFGLMAPSHMSSTILAENAPELLIPTRVMNIAMSSALKMFSETNKPIFTPLVYSQLATGKDVVSANKYSLNTGSRSRTKKVYSNIGRTITFDPRSNIEPLKVGLGYDIWRGSSYTDPGSLLRELHKKQIGVSAFDVETFSLSGLEGLDRVLGRYGLGADDTTAILEIAFSIMDPKEVARGAGKSVQSFSPHRGLLTEALQLIPLTFENDNGVSEFERLLRLKYQTATFKQDKYMNVADSLLFQAKLYMDKIESGAVVLSSPEEKAMYSLMVKRAESLRNNEQIAKLVLGVEKNTAEEAELLHRISFAAIKFGKKNLQMELGRIGNSGSSFNEFIGSIVEGNALMGWNIQEQTAGRSIDSATLRDSLDVAAVYGAAKALGYPQELLDALEYRLHTTTMIDPMYFSGGIGAKSREMGDVAQALKISTGGAHSANVDVEQLIQIASKLIGPVDFDSDNQSVIHALLPHGARFNAYRVSKEGQLRASAKGYTVLGTIVANERSPYVVYAEDAYYKKFKADESFLVPKKLRRSLGVALTRFAENGGKVGERESLIAVLGTLERGQGAQGALAGFLGKNGARAAGIIGGKNGERGNALVEVSKNLVMALNSGDKVSSIFGQSRSPVNIGRIGKVLDDAITAGQHVPSKGISAGFLYEERDAIKFGIDLIEDELSMEDPFEVVSQLLDTDKRLRQTFSVADRRKSHVTRRLLGNKTYRGIISSYVNPDMMDSGGSELINALTNLRGNLNLSIQEGKNNLRINKKDFSIHSKKELAQGELPGLEHLSLKETQALADLLADLLDPMGYNGTAPYAYRSSAKYITEDTLKHESKIRILSNITEDAPFIFPNKSSAQMASTAAAASLGFEKAIESINISINSIEDEQQILIDALGKSSVSQRETMREAKDRLSNILELQSDKLTTLESSRLKTLLIHIEQLTLDDANPDQRQDAVKGIMRWMQGFNKDRADRDTAFLSKGRIRSKVWHNGFEGTVGMLFTVEAIVDEYLSPSISILRQISNKGQDREALKAARASLEKASSFSTGILGTIFNGRAIANSSEERKNELLRWQNETNSLIKQYSTSSPMSATEQYKIEGSIRSSNRNLERLESEYDNLVRRLGNDKAAKSPRAIFLSDNIKVAKAQINALQKRLLNAEGIPELSRLINVTGITGLDEGLDDFSKLNAINEWINNELKNPTSSPSDAGLAGLELLGLYIKKENGKLRIKYDEGLVSKGLQGIARGIKESGGEFLKQLGDLPIALNIPGMSEGLHIAPQSSIMRNATFNLNAEGSVSKYAAIFNMFRGTTLNALEAEGGQNSVYQYIAKAGMAGKDNLSDKNPLFTRVFSGIQKILNPGEEMGGETLRETVKSERAIAEEGGFGGAFRQLNKSVSQDFETIFTKALGAFGINQEEMSGIDRFIQTNKGKRMMALVLGNAGVADVFTRGIQEAWERKLSSAAGQVGEEAGLIISFRDSGIQSTSFALDISSPEKIQEASDNLKGFLTSLDSNHEQVFRALGKEGGTNAFDFVNRVADAYRKGKRFIGTEGGTRVEIQAIPNLEKLAEIGGSLFTAGERRKLSRDVLKAAAGFKTSTSRYSLMYNFVRHGVGGDYGLAGVMQREVETFDGKRKMLEQAKDTQEILGKVFTGAANSFMEVNYIRGEVSLSQDFFETSLDHIKGSHARAQTETPGGNLYNMERQPGGSKSPSFSDELSLNRYGKGLGSLRAKILRSPELSGQLMTAEQKLELRSSTNIILNQAWDIVNQEAGESAYEAEDYKTIYKTQRKLIEGMILDRDGFQDNFYRIFGADNDATRDKINYKLDEVIDIAAGYLDNEKQTDIPLHTAISSALNEYNSRGGNFGVEDIVAENKRRNEADWQTYMNTARSYSPGALPHYLAQGARPLSYHTMENAIMWMGKNKEALTHMGAMGLVGMAAFGLVAGLGSPLQPNRPLSGAGKPASWDHKFYNPDRNYGAPAPLSTIFMPATQAAQKYIFEVKGQIGSKKDFNSEKFIESIHSALADKGMNANKVTYSEIDQTEPVDSYRAQRASRVNAY